MDEALLNQLLANKQTFQLKSAPDGEEGSTILTTDTGSYAVKKSETSNSYFVANSKLEIFKSCNYVIELDKIKTMKN